MRVLLAVSLLLAVWAVEGKRQKRMYPVRCYPGTECWPSDQEIAHLDKYTVGNLLQPASSDYRNYVLYVNERLTKHPGLVLVAQTSDDVRKGVLFARKFNLLLSVRAANSLTYDLTGRLTNDGGFVIDLSNLKTVSSTAVVTSQAAGSVQVGAGATWQDVYSVVESTGRIAVGTNPSDGVYETTLTGGISPVSRSMGLVSDNLLSAQVIMADGRLATVNPAGATIYNADGESVVSTDSSLFYALRGGGFNWAVPVSFTYRLYFPPFQMAGFNAQYNLYVDGSFLGRDALKFVLREVSGLPSAWGGYIMVDGTPSTLDPADKGSIKLNLLYYGQWNGVGSTSMSNLQNYAPTGVLNNPVNINIFDNLQQFRGATGEGDVFDSWPNKYVANRLIKNDVFTNNTKFEEFLDLLVGVVNAPAVESNVRCILRMLGGQIAAQASNDDAISQAYRDAIMSVTCGLTWKDTAVKESVYVSHAYKGAQMLKNFGSGVDPRFAAEDLEDWKMGVFGSKYKSLLETKSKWDVDNFLWTYNHVASDFRLKCGRGRCH